MISGLLFFYGVCFAIVFLQNVSALSTVWLPMKAVIVIFFSGATQSSVKSSDCVTNFPVQGGIAADCVPLPRMWFSGLIQYKHRELEGGSLVVRLPQAQPRVWFSGERYQTARLRFFTWQKQLFVYVPQLCTDWSHRECFQVLRKSKGEVKKKKPKKLSAVSHG